MHIRWCQHKKILQCESERHLKQMEEERATSKQNLKPNKCKGRGGWQEKNKNKLCDGFYTNQEAHMVKVTLN